MSDVPENLKYTRSHEWIRMEEDGTLTVGITEHAQNELGDVVFVELPEEGTQFELDDTIGVIESVKAASDLYSPLSAEVIACNQDLTDSPELINQSPYQEGWLFKLKPTGKNGMEMLLTAAQYIASLEDES
ncbi:MAG: glycine cleavage system protein GcvH [Thiomargarita sp.]|nr:glycine cleavage system protein GcvH [Thiomargarita sp.]